MQIISAVDHGERVVIRVCHNPDSPEWVHMVGDQERDAHGLYLFNSDGSPKLIVSAACLLDGAGVSCHNCRYNWDVTEVILDGLELLGPDGLRLADDTLGVRALSLSKKGFIARSILGIIGLGG